MQWTYATVDAFYHDQNGLQAHLDRLLQNQKDIGAAIMPYYGQAAGGALAALLTTHINQAVPVLQAAQANDQPALDAALSDWYANAKEIADFLSAANPEHWQQADMEQSMEHHITQTTAYAVSLLTGDFSNAVVQYDEAFDHMMETADLLAKGIALQFPDQF
ncbi:MAG: glycosyltransferase [Sphingobacteriales bacterium]|nr:glycosyltransferase [Sphingobacteriales bacterium]